MARVLDNRSDVYNLSNLGAKIPVAWWVFFYMYDIIRTHVSYEWCKTLENYEIHNYIFKCSLTNHKGSFILW